MKESETIYSVSLNSIMLSAAVNPAFQMIAGQNEKSLTKSGLNSEDCFGLM